MTAVERETYCIVSYKVVWERTWEAMQDVVDGAPATKSYSDAFLPYSCLRYHGEHQMLPNKSQTYSVEGGNSVFRHYLGRLLRENRCINRCIHALRRAVDLFVFVWNQRQRHNRAYPKYKKHLIKFVNTIL